MGRADFLDKIQKDIATYEAAYQDAKNAELRIQEVEQHYGMLLKHIHFDIRRFYTKVINDSTIDYCLLAFFKDVGKFNNRTNKFKELAIDWIKIKDYTNKKEISDDTFVYISLHFYSSNFDNLMNLLRGVAREIQKSKKYTITTSKGKVKLLKSNTSEEVVNIIKQYDFKFFYSLDKIANRHLRNKVAHDQYEIKNNKIYYDSRFINRDNLFNLIVGYSDFIHKLQLFEFEEFIKTSKVIYSRRLTKKEIKYFFKMYTI